MSVILDHCMSTVPPLLPVASYLLSYLNLSFAYGTDREINTLVVLCRYRFSPSFAAFVNYRQFLYHYTYTKTHYRLVPSECANLAESQLAIKYIW